MNYVHIKASLGSADLRTVEFDVENFLEFTTIFETTFLKSSLCLSVYLSVSLCLSLSLSHTHHTHYKIGSFDVLLFLNPHITFTVKIMDISREVNLRKLIVSIFVDQTWERSIRGFPP